MYSCVFWCELIDLVGFFGCYCLTLVILFKHSNTSKVSLLNLFYRKKSKD